MVVPVVCLVLLWLVAVSFTPGGALVRHGLFSPGHKDLAQVALYAGGGILIVILAVWLMGSFSRRLSQDLSDLEAMARRLASEPLPQTGASLEAATTRGTGTESIAWPRGRTAEVVGTAAAMTGLRKSAVAAAADGISLRDGIAQVFVSLARRNQSLLQRQLRLIDALEQKATDPAALADLFSLDHLTTRMRRHAENLIILSGAAPGRTWSEPVPVIDVVRGALAEVEDYQRVRVVTRTQDAVIGSAVADMIHLLAELIENAALFSPSDTRVEVRAERVANGFAIEVEDRGLGMQPTVMAEINRQLLSPPDFALADPDRLGLFVVGRLAGRHGIRVSLNPSPYGGTTAVALVPHNVVLPTTQTGAGAPSEAVLPPGRPVELDWRSADALVLTSGHAETPGRHADTTASPRDSFLPPGTSGGPLGPGSSGSGSFASGSSFSPDDLDRPGSRFSASDRSWAGSPASSPAGDPIRSAQAEVIGSSLDPDYGGVPGSPSGSGESDRIEGTARTESLSSPDDDQSGAMFRFGTGRFSPGDRYGSTAAGTREPGSGAPDDTDVFGLGSAFRGSASPGTSGDPLPTRGSTGSTGSTGGTYRGLPRRVRQASLSPHLRDSSPSSDVPPLGGPAAEPAPELTPERARDVVASFRAGWQRESGEVTDPAPDQETGAEPAMPQDSAARDGEEA
ncbi:MAG TPA: ATP-binding protein [Streptosporangiaceae bacterium]|nr:ATP-binding protein [Streptosporangiaceae bacterium]